MNSIAALKTVNDDLQVEYEILSPIDISALTNPAQREIALALQNVDAQICLCENELAKLSTEIDRLTNHADGFDYAVSVISGIISGMIDSVFVGETEIDKDKIQKLLEEKYHTANDSGYRHKDADGHWASSAMYHRLDDLAHHPSIAGLVAAILVRYFRLVIFIDGTDGKPHIFFADTNSPKVTELEKKEQTKAWIGAIIGGLCLWLSNLSIKKYEEIECEEVPAPLKKLIKVVGATPLILEILKAVDVWVGHMMSDVSTSQGIPGIFLSLLKEISVLPIIRNTDFRVWVDALYRKGNNNLSEWGGVVFVAAKKQSLPVLVNELLVRTFYFIRHLVEEYKKHEAFDGVDWSRVIPFGNRTVERMMTIATGTFTAVDMADAAIRSGGFNAACLLRVNFVGVGRFAIAVVTDVSMRIKRGKLQNERYALLGQQLDLLNTKVYYLDASANYEMCDAFDEQSRLWIAAENTTATLIEASATVVNTIEFYSESLQEIQENFERISSYLSTVEEKNPGLTEEILRMIRWGKL